ncbi:MAG: PAS domain S-box protein [Mariprofundaceae bacterium]|nr:PAS domain S-box protein [Mariprofundaceae bacterium]
MAKPFLQSSLRTLFASVMGVIFFSELLIMVFFYFLGKDSSSSDVLLDSVLLIALVSGPLYLIIFRPLRRQGQEAEMVAEMLHAVEQHMPDALVTSDNKGVIERFNPAAERMFGWPREKVVGRNVSMLMPEPHASRHDDYLRKYLQTGKPKVMGRFRELEGKRRDGSLVPIEIEASDLHVGRWGGFVAVIRDISERRRVEAEKQHLQLRMEHLQRQESLGVLAGGVAHDFKNILAVIQGNAEMIGTDKTLSTEVEEHLAGITSSCERAVQLCTQMLTYAGSRSRRMQAVNFSTVVDDAMPAIRALIPTHITLHPEVQVAALPEAVADALLVEQALLNLLNNAIEAIGDCSGHIRLAGGIQSVGESDIENMMMLEKVDAGDFVWLEVADDGEGMTDDVRQHVYEPFFTTRFTGRGLGMSAVLGIMRSHQGAIRIDSEATKGCRVRLLFPLNQAQ